MHFLIGNKGVSLRPCTEADIPALLKIFNDEKTRAFADWSMPAYEHTTREWLKSQTGKDKADIVLGIEVKKKLIGIIGLYRISLKDRHASLAITIGSHQHVSKGYGTEAMTLMLGYAFHTLNLRKVYLSVLETNARAISLYKKCGFCEIGRYHKHVFVDDTYANKLLMEVFREQWEASLRRPSSHP